MKRGYFLLLFILLLLVIFVSRDKDHIDNPTKSLPRQHSTSSPESPKEMKKGRLEYFFMILRDPATNHIPANIRQKELEFANSYKRLNKSAAQSLLSPNWIEAGPNDVGGRTRALAIDLDNPNTVLAGGVSGGIWKSTNNGETWQMKSQAYQALSVTSIAQDPRPGFRNIWYYTAGEYIGGSAWDMSGQARFMGDGVYKSTDSGETWNILPFTQSSDPARWESDFDYTSKVIVSKTGNVFIACNGFGISRSADGGKTFKRSLGGVGEHRFSDIVIAANGMLIAVISDPLTGYNAKNSPGIYKSSDEGLSWTNTTPKDFPTSHSRSVLATAPSNPDIAYVFTFTGITNNNREEILFYKMNLSTGESENRSANLPEFGSGNVFGGYIDTQGNYNMTLAVKPDDENFVLIAGTCLFRSTNGFSTKSNNKLKDWIGGYHTEQRALYPNFHCDIHCFSFDPTDPNKMWWGHDGGVSYTTNIANTIYTDYFPWENKNHGYNVTQFYTITIPEKANDNRIMGGTQDNGTPIFSCDGTSTTISEDVSTGDGAYAYFGKDYAYVSSQNGFVARLTYDNNGKPNTKGVWSYVYPKDAKNQLFIDPYVIDPNDEDYMYYPAGGVLWRNNQLSSIPNYQNGTTTGWQKLDALSAPANYYISAITVSNKPSHILYYAASSFQGSPKIYRLENSTTATSGADDISIPDAPAGAWVHHIAINPDNADEILVVFSNYNVVGLYHSSDGGKTYTAVEGNLEGTKENPGPSIRAATIKNTNGGSVYLLATSIGVFSSLKLNGANTAWVQEGASVIGNVVVDDIVTRSADGRVVAATHGRGAFIGNITTGNIAVISIDALNVPIKLASNTTASSTFKLKNTGTANLVYSITANYTGKVSQQNSYSGVLPKAASLNSKSQPFNGSQNSNQNRSAVSSEKERFILTAGSDQIVLDNGDEKADNTLGWGDGTNFTWFNEFNLDGFSFKLEKIQFYMRSESALMNSNYIYVLDKNQDTLRLNVESFDVSAEGQWYSYTLKEPVNFSNGDKFYLGIGTFFGGIDYPAGFDSIGAVQGKSYYQDKDSKKLVKLNTIKAFAKSAFLIRAVGTKTTGNQHPVAIATLSKNEAQVNEQIIFDASKSTDPDGQIVSYQWNFGDGKSSTQKIQTHLYSAEGAYNYTLTVTDNMGATGEANGEVVIKSTASNKPPVAVATLSKQQAQINESISFDASASYDQDGQITSYEWNFGDGSSSSEKVAVHSYTQPNTYNYSLKVTDNKGASGSAAGQIKITADIIRLTVSPSNGTVAPGESQTITVSFNAQDLTDGEYKGILKITSNGGDITLPVNIIVGQPVAVSNMNEEPGRYYLAQNYPNPFNPLTKIDFQIPRSELVSLIIYDISGREVRKVINSRMSRGVHTVSFDGSNLSSGIYLYRLEAGSFTDVKKLVLIK